MVSIKHITSVLPNFKNTTEDILKAAERFWFPHINEDSARMAKKIILSAGIKERYSVIPLEVAFANLSFEEKNNFFKEATIDLGKKVLARAFNETGLKPTEIDYIITTSCTGFMIPSVDAYLVDHFGMRKDVVRLPVTEMGCAGGTSGLIYATNFLQANPKKRVALLALETPSVTFQKNDLSMENIVSTAIFADGASCVILEGDEVAKDKGARYYIQDYNMYHFTQGTHLMGYNLINSGLKIVLDRDVPDQIGANLPHILLPFLQKNNLGLEQVQHFYLHPGGKKIINMTEDYIGRFGGNVDFSKAVLYERGNMSSATVLHILEKALQKNSSGEKIIKQHDRALMLAFGPGFSAQTLILEWR